MGCTGTGAPARYPPDGAARDFGFADCHTTGDGTFRSVPPTPTIGRGYYGAGALLTYDSQLRNSNSAATVKAIIQNQPTAVPMILARLMPGVSSSDSTSARMPLTPIKSCS